MVRFGVVGIDLERVAELDLGLRILAFLEVALAAL